MTTAYPIQVKTSSGTVIILKSDTEYTRQSSAATGEKTHTCLYWGADTRRGVALSKVLGNHSLVFAVAVGDEEYGGNLVRTFRTTPAVEIDGVPVAPVAVTADDPDEDEEKEGPGLLEEDE